MRVKISDLNDGLIEKDSPVTYCEICKKELVANDEFVIYGDTVLCDGVH